MSDSPPNPFEPRFPGFSGFAPMMEQMESFRRLWSSMDVPSRLVPTLDIGELDKRIADLKAVEQWLNLNLGMLRGSIQGLEIQRGTLAAVQAFGSAFQGQGMGAGPLNAGAASAAAKASSGPAAQAKPPGPFAASPAAPSSASPSAAPSAAPSASPAVPGIDPSAWWNLLQNNFQQIAQAAMAGASLPGTAPAPALSQPSQAPGKRAPRSTSGPAPRSASPKPAARKTARGR